MKLTGLSEAEVREKIARGETNAFDDGNSRKTSDILRENIFTRFNFLLVALSAAILFAGGGLINMLAITGVIFNSAIGIFQELSAKKTLDKITILNATKVKVIREGKIREILITEVVKDDYIVLKLGDQIVADGEILRSDELEVDESLLTGESDPMLKKLREKVLSGSIVVAGSGVMRAEKVGAEAYSAKLIAETKQYKSVNSEIQSSINKILTWISWSLIVIVPVLIIGQLQIRGQWQSSVLRAIAAIIAMIPNGLVVLASMAFMIAAVKLARKKVLIQRMPAVETLARVDTLLLDKTGTLTEGNIKFETTILSDNSRKKEVDVVLRTLASRNSAPTNNAIAEALMDEKIAKFSREIQFSSARKFSAITIDGRDYVLGASEILLADKKFAKNLSEIEKIAADGKRVLVLAENSEIFAKIAGEKDQDFTKIFAKNKPLATVILSEKIRENAGETLRFFAEQNVGIKIISGDSPTTVAAIARRIGLEDIRQFDARKLPKIHLDFREKISKKSQEDFAKNMDEGQKLFAKIVAEHNVFGRVNPEQKRQIARILQLQNRTVAMTGDGVNDALALKTADLGIAMESGSEATKSVAEIVLLDNDFAHLPSVLAEGRRVIANIERVANVFIVKNVFVLFVSLASTMAGLLHPYLPIQMSVIDFLAIGFPAFFLALAPNKRIYRPGFLRRILRFAIPVGSVVGATVMSGYFLMHHDGMPISVSGTAVSVITMICLLAVLILLARPFVWWKIAIICVSAVGFLLAILTPAARLFKYNLDPKIVLPTVIIGLIGALVVFAISQINERFFAKHD